MTKESWIELQKENMDFSIGHFTIFSATERENLHGHNYNVYLGLRVLIDNNGMSFDYRTYKKKCYELCQTLNQSLLIPEQSSYLTIAEEQGYVAVHFAGEKLLFLPRDITLMPLTNITVEDLSSWFVDELTRDQTELDTDQVQELVIKVFSAPGQSGSARWLRKN